MGFGLYSVITTVTELTVTSRVWALERSTFFKRAGYFLCLFLFRDNFDDFDVLDVPFGTPDDAPGSVAACWATSAELRRGFRVDVPSLSTNQNSLNSPFKWNTYSDHTMRRSRLLLPDYVKRLRKD